MAADFDWESADLDWEPVDFSLESSDLEKLLATLDFGPPDFALELAGLEKLLADLDVELPDLDQEETRRFQAMADLGAILTAVAWEWPDIPWGEIDDRTLPIDTATVAARCGWAKRTRERVGGLRRVEARGGCARW